MVRPQHLPDWRDHNTLWQKYCGFLDLSLRDFMEIQEQLLMEQIGLVGRSPLGRRLLRGRLPQSMAEFREGMPLTTYGDYLPELGERGSSALGVEPYAWAHTTGAQAGFKLVPYTQQGFERTLDNLMGAFILACASRKGEIALPETPRVLYNTPGRPYLSGLISFGLAQRFGFQGVLDPEASEEMDFQERIERGFRESLRTGVDIVVSMTSVLVRVGRRFNELSQDSKASGLMLDPMVLLRLTKALLYSKMARRSILPKDLWPVKAILGWGIDTSIFKEEVARYWGKMPYEFYACTEGGAMALQGWNRKGLTLVPYSDFYEFIPEEESLKSRQDRDYHPHTVLLNQLEENQIYEMVITNFHGMPFLRYRVGHWVKVISLEDREAGIGLPQFAFEGRCDDRIDIAGFTRIDEKTVWETLAKVKLKSQDWTIRKEYVGEKPILHLYVELEEEIADEEAARLLHESLKTVDPFYQDLETMLGMRPLKVTCLSQGTFERYYEEKRGEGLDLGQLRPPHMNATDLAIRDLLRLSHVGLLKA